MGRLEQMYLPFGESEDPEDQVHLEAFKADLERLEERTGDEWANEMRKIGLYVRDAHPIAQPGSMGHRPILVMTCSAGKVAFSERVQFPDKASFESEMKTVIDEGQVDGFLDARSEIEQALNDGQDPFGN